VAEISESYRDGVNYTAGFVALTRHL